MEDQMKTLEGLDDQLQTLNAMEADASGGAEDMVLILALATKISNAVSKIQKEAKAGLLKFLDEKGYDSLSVAGRLIGTSERRFWGIAQGQTPGEQEANRASVLAFMDEHAPGLNFPASTNINKAVNEFLDVNPGAEVPDFLSEVVKTTLTNRQGK